MTTQKQEVVDEIGDILDSLSPDEAIQILNKLTQFELIKLKHAIEEAIIDAKVKATDGRS